jgi:hypothetical protein
MYPEDRVLVGVMPDPRDLEIAHQQHWYRIPAKHASQGIHAEYVAFYFTRKFGPELCWAIHFYARRTGHELVRRVDLLPDQPDHPHARDMYYKLQLGPIKQKDPPIVSLRWRRITFIQTTWDRFITATEINDLFSSDNVYVDRIYHSLKQRGIQAERAVEVREGDTRYAVDLLIPCRDGAVMLSGSDERPAASLPIDEDETQTLARAESAIEKRGGPLMLDLPF